MDVVDSSPSVLHSGGGMDVVDIHHHQVPVSHVGVTTINKSNLHISRVGDVGGFTGGVLVERWFFWFGPYDLLPWRVTRVDIFGVTWWLGLGIR
jgi:hypothetical protein